MCMCLGPGQPAGLAGQPDAQLWLVVLYQPIPAYGIAVRGAERVTPYM